MLAKSGHVAASYLLFALALCHVLAARRPGASETTITAPHEEETRE